MKLKKRTITACNSMFVDVGFLHLVQNLGPLKRQRETWRECDGDGEIEIEGRRWREGNGGKEKEMKGRRRKRK